MKAKLHITHITIQNYKVFGGPVSIELDGLGPVLVSGDNGVGKTTAFADAIVWCLFNRTINKARPGDSIINWECGKDTLVELKTQDGWVIKRTRKMANHHDLLIYNEKKEDITPSTNQNAQKLLEKLFNLDYDIFISAILFGQSETSSFLKLSDQKRKAAIERILSLDNLNDRSATANQLAKEQKDKLVTLNARINGLERDKERLHTQIDSNENNRINYAKTIRDKERDIKERIQNVKLKINELPSYDKDSIINKWQAIDKILLKIKPLEDDLDKWNSQLNDVNSKINVINAKLQLYNKIDIKKLHDDHADYKESTNIIEQLNNKINEHDKILSKLKSEQQRLTINIDHYREKLEEWKTKSGTCPNCDQQIPEHLISEHIIDYSKQLEEAEAIRDNKLDNIQKMIKIKQELEHKISAIRQHIEELDISTTIEEAEQHNASIDQINGQLNKLEEERDLLNNNIDNNKKKIEHIHTVINDNKPSITIDKLNMAVERKQILHDELQKLTKELNNIDINNPYDEVIKNLRHDLESTNKELEEFNKETDNINIEIRHLEYIRRAYGDRNKVKKMLFSRLMPYFNRRIAYYGELFEIPISVEFTDTLSLNSTTWPYEECSGGEKCRIAVAVMFALYDLLLSIYGPQCNIMIMDEIDKELDPQGVQSFVESIERFTSSEDKPNTIFVISHKTVLKSSFPTEIAVSKNGFSKITFVNS